MTSRNSIVGTAGDQTPEKLSPSSSGPGGVPVLFDRESVSQLIAERNTAA